MDELNKQKTQFNLDSFTKVNDHMININVKSQINSNFRDVSNYTYSHTYTLDEVQDILLHGSLNAKQELSCNYFNQNGYYKELIIYYATLLKYVGILIPKMGLNKSLSNSNLNKKYNNALDFLERINLPAFLTNCAKSCLLYGAYYGLILDDKKVFKVINLPISYCNNNYTNAFGEDLIEFDLTYFDTFTDKTYREQILSQYPDFIEKAYRRYTKGKSSKIIIPENNAICFTLFDSIPFFINVIPSIMQYDYSVELELEKALNDIRKIIVQKIPHLTDGRLLFEDVEAEEMHRATVGMLKGNKNLSVLTTYADIDDISSDVHRDSADNLLDRMESNVFSRSGVSSQIFASSGSNTLNQSIKKDISIMMVLANQFSSFITKLINRLFSNTALSFRYVILSVTYQTEADFVEEAFKLTGSGYSFLLPFLALGFSQNDLLNIKILENDILKLRDHLIPLQTSYTQSGTNNTDVDEGGRPQMDDSEKQDITITTQESKQG